MYTMAATAISLYPYLSWAHTATMLEPKYVVAALILNTVQTFIGCCRAINPYHVDASEENIQDV